MTEEPIQSLLPSLFRACQEIVRAQTLPTLTGEVKLDSEGVRVSFHLFSAVQSAVLHDKEQTLRVIEVGSPGSGLVVVLADTGFRLPRRAAARVRLLEAALSVSRGLSAKLFLAEDRLEAAVDLVVGAEPEPEDLKRHVSLGIRRLIETLADLDNHIWRQDLFSRASGLLRLDEIRSLIETRSQTIARQVQGAEEKPAEEAVQRPVLLKVN